MELRIHRGNYEEFFLLYVDHELSATEMQAVEDFVLKHPDLKIELDILLDTKLHLDEVSFEAKGSLLKTEQKSVEELQLLSIDNELNHEQADALEAFHRTDKKALAEFEWLKKTKLPPEAIIYPNKEKLYKRSAPVLLMRWITPAAAAAVLILMFVLNHPEETTVISVPEKVVAKLENDVTNQTEPRITDKQTVEPVKEMIKKENISDSPAPVESANVATTEQPQSDPTFVAIETTPEPKTDPVIETSVTVRNTPQPTATIKADYALEALAENTPSDDDEHPKKGLRGFVRKASRIYKKITSPDSEN